VTPVKPLKKLCVTPEEQKGPPARIKVLKDYEHDKVCPQHSVACSAVLGGFRRCEKGALPK
jgi:hypothetical protein